MKNSGTEIAAQGDDVDESVVETVLADRRDEPEKIESGTATPAATPARNIVLPAEPEVRGDVPLIGERLPGSPLAK